MSRLGARRTGLTVVFAILALTGLLGPHLAQAQAPHVLILNIGGIINPVKEGFIARALEQAEQDQATLVVMELDTPGGLLSSTRNIVEQLLEASVPIAVYVSPRGARAGSAGTFITAAAHLAVMAPGTNIGAATPVSATGEDIPETLASKVENDAAALIRSIAQERGRNQDKLEETVREAASFTAKEAVELNIVDFIANDLEDLLAQVDGRIVETVKGPRTLDLRDVERRRFSKNALEIFLEIISDPNVSFILLTLGGLGLIVELFNPGLIAPGVVGVIFLLLAFLASGNLPVNWAGVVFIFVAIALVVLETLVAGFGILGVGAIISFLVGGLILFTQFGDVSPTLPSISVSRWVLSGTGAVLALSLVYVVGLAYQSRKQGPPLKAVGLTGSRGTVTGELAPRGVVLVGNETWTAISEDDSVIPVGEPVEVRTVNGLVLTVFRQVDPDREENA